MTSAIDLNAEKVKFFGHIEFEFLRKFYKKVPVEDFERLPYWWEPETPGSRGLSKMNSWEFKDSVMINFYKR